MASVFARLPGAQAAGPTCGHTGPRLIRNDHYPGAAPRRGGSRGRRARQQGLTDEYLFGLGAGVDSVMPEEEKAPLRRLFKSATSPGALAAMERMNLEIDIRDVLPIIYVPTLVMNRKQTPAVPLRTSTRRESASESTARGSSNTPATAIPPAFPSIVSTSPVCTPARISMPRWRTATDRQRASDRSRRAVERGEEAVPGGVHLGPAEPAEQVPHDAVVTLDEIAPSRVAELRRFPGRTDDVREQDRREGHGRRRSPARAGDELLDLRDISSGPALEEQVLVARRTPTNRAPSMRGPGRVPRRRWRPVARSVHHQGRRRGCSGGRRGCRGPGSSVRGREARVSRGPPQPADPLLSPRTCRRPTPAPSRTGTRRSSPARPGPRSRRRLLHGAAPGVVVVRIHVAWVPHRMRPLVRSGTSPRRRTPCCRPRTCRRRTRARSPRRPSPRGYRRFAPRASPGPTGGRSSPFPVCRTGSTSERAQPLDQRRPPPGCPRTAPGATPSPAACTRSTGLSSPVTW